MTPAMAVGLLVMAAVLLGRGLRAATSRARTRARLPLAEVEGPPGAGSLAPRWLVTRLEAADVTVAPAVAVRLGAGAAVSAGLLGLATGGVPLAVGAVVVVGAGPVLALGAFGGRADRRLETSFPEALEAVGRALRGGASLSGALAEAGRVTPGRLGHELRDLWASNAAGVPLVEALDRWVARDPLPAVRLGAAALALAAETGGASARAVDGVAETVRGRLVVAAEIRALSAQARFSALVIVLAPLAFSGLAMASDDGVTQFLLRSPAGLACLAAGLGLDVVAALWMQRLSRVEV